MSWDFLTSSVTSLLPTPSFTPAATIPAPLPLSLRVITHNIRYAATNLFDNERPWPERAPLVLNQLRHEVRGFVPPLGSTSSETNGSPSEPSSAVPYAGAFICLQEVLHPQLVDVLAGLNDGIASDPDPDPPAEGWRHIGVGRDDGAQQGEYSPILYPAGTFRVVHNETVWLSPTPDRPSKGWDAGSVRLLTVGVFEHAATGRRLVAANTHLDNAGPRSRRESVPIILRTLDRVRAEWAPGGGDGGGGANGTLPVFLAGDFNSSPAQEAYLAMKESGWMRDLHDEIPEGERYGNDITFTGFRPDRDKDQQGRIDYIWLGAGKEGEGQQWEAEGYAVLPNVFDSGVYLSDHRAVVGDLRML